MRMLPIYRMVVWGGFLLCVTQWGPAIWIVAKAQIASGLINSAWVSAQTHPKQKFRPWPWADTWPVGELVWTAGSGKKNKRFIVLSNAQGESLAFGPTLHAQSSATSVADWWVIAGHRDTHFRFLKDVNIGDRLAWREPDGAQFDFVVYKTEIVNIYYLGGSKQYMSFLEERFY